MAQRADHRRLIEADEAERVVHVRRQPRALREEIEHAELARDPGVPELELGIEIDHAVVPVKLAAIDHDALGRGEKRLGGRADLEHRARIDRRAAGLAAHAEAFGVDESVAGDDADRKARHAERLHGAACVGLEIGNERLDAAFRGGGGIGQVAPARPLGSCMRARRPRRQGASD